MRGDHCGKERCVCQREEWVGAKRRGVTASPLASQFSKKGTYLFPFFIFPPFFLAAFFFLGMATHLLSRLEGLGSRESPARGTASRMRGHPPFPAVSGAPGSCRRGGVSVSGESSTRTFGQTLPTSHGHHGRSLIPPSRRRSSLRSG